MSNKVVTRFAPSPTGFMHVGGVRTALYAWLYARKMGGSFILRIEDTDKEREVTGSKEHIVESLKWLGLDFDQGPILQSERLDIYKTYAEKLIASGHAYADPYTEEEVEAFRKKAEEEKRPFLYRDHRPAETQAWGGTTPLRFKVPTIKRFEWYDMVRGELSAGEEALDDFILIKTDGYPTYNFAHIVDDIEMQVTHVMRGEEFISSTPKFLSLYEALGATVPMFATLPVILGPDGNKKLSKRDGAKDILDYEREGYLPEGFINFLAFLGWNPGDDREVMTVAELIEAFSVERVQKGGAKFDEVKLHWFNHEHMRKLSAEYFTKYLEHFATSRKTALPAYAKDIAHLLQERAQTLEEALLAITGGEFNFLDTEPTPTPELLIQGSKADAASAKKHLAAVSTLLTQLSTEDFTSEKIKQVVFPYATEAGRASVLWPMRVALSGKEKSPDPFMLAGLLGKEKTLSRIAAAQQIL